MRAWPRFQHTATPYARLLCRQPPQQQDRQRRTCQRLGAQLGVCEVLRQLQHACRVPCCRQACESVAAGQHALRKSAQTGGC